MARAVARFSLAMARFFHPVCQEQGTVAPTRPMHNRAPALVQARVGPKPPFKLTEAAEAAQWWHTLAALVRTLQCVQSKPGTAQAQAAAIVADILALLQRAPSKEATVGDQLDEPSIAAYARVVGRVTEQQWRARPRDLAGMNGEDELLGDIAHLQEVVTRQERGSERKDFAQ